MSDFTTIRAEFNSGTDASPVWNPVTFGGSGGQQEIRWSASGAGAANIGSASWPQYSRPASSTQAVPELWFFTTADNSGGVKCSTYDGTNGHANVMCIDFDALGTYAAGPSFSAFGDSSHAAPVPGTQPGALSGSPIVNGQVTDTSNTSYIKGNMYGTAQVGNPAAGSVGTAPTATTGTAGAVSPGAAAWATNWQSLQGVIQYLLFPSTPAPTTAGKIFLNFILLTGVNMALGTLQMVLTWTYSFV